MYMYVKPCAFVLCIGVDVVVVIVSLVVVNLEYLLVLDTVTVILSLRVVQVRTGAQLAVCMHC